MRFRRRIAFIIFVVIIFLGTFSMQVNANEYVYIFSPDAKFIKVDTKNFHIVDVGNLWWTGLFKMYGVVSDPSKRQIFVATSDLSNLLNLPKQLSGIVILDEFQWGKSAGSLKLLHIIQPPMNATDFIGAKIINGNMRMILLSWYEQNKEVTVMLDGNTYEELQRIENFVVFPMTCLSADRTRLYSVRDGSPSEIINLDLKSMAVQRTLYDKIGSANFHSKTPVAFRDCTVLILEYKEKPTEDRVAGTLFLYDIEKDKILSTLKTDIQGDFFILKEGALIAVNEKKLVPNVFPDGSVVGVRFKKVGRLHFYDANTGKELSLLNLPEDGTFVTISSDEKTGYYLSPKLLTVVNLEHYRVQATIQIPFSEGVAAFYESES